MVKEFFRESFGRSPDSEASAPGRVNLIGEHLDYNGGMVLPMAIERKVSISVAQSDDAHDHFLSTDFVEENTRKLEQPRAGAWSDYVAGAVQKARNVGLIDTGVLLAIDSDLPHGAGLSSSAAVIVATLKATAKLGDQSVDAVQIALWAQQVEHDYIGVPCGNMDQMAVAIAELGQALALDTLTLNHETIRLPADHQFAVLHSGISRKLDDGGYAKRRAECEAAARRLGVDHLCLMDANTTTKLPALPEIEMRRARHCVNEQRRTLGAIGALKVGDMGRFGVLMNESHASMRDDFEISTPEIDGIVAQAREYGATGARLTGGGFGGCIVACMPKNIFADWSDAMLSAFANARLIT